MYVEIIKDDRITIPVLYQGPKGETGPTGATGEKGDTGTDIMVPSDIATFALMLVACLANQPRAFIVLNDEFQLDADVPYTWTGRVLLEYGINKCDTQPTI